MRSIKQQAGLSLIELMISITLGLILMAAATQSMLSTKQTYEVNDDLSRTQENGRLALSLMVKDLRMAGYRDPNNGDAPGFFLDTACGVINPCTNNGEGTGTASDRFAVQFDPAADDGTETDCAGNLVGATDVIANIYHITTANGVNSLSCRSFNSTTGVLGAAQPLIDGVDSMHVLYGLGAGGSVTRFVSADSVADWSSVMAVRVAVLVGNGQAAGSGRDRSRSYIVLDADKQTFTDSHMRSIYSTTVFFNNAALD
jgi:type IV pilus assembly protein PilW